MATDSVVITPTEDGTFRMSLKEAGGGRLKHVALWPQTLLVTLCARLAGFSRYDELPARNSPDDLAWLLSPMIWPIWVDASGFSASDVRHIEKEGRALRSLRYGLRLHLSTAPASLLTEAESFLQSCHAAISLASTDDLLSSLLQELKPKADSLSVALTSAYAAAKYPGDAQAARVLVQANVAIDPCLPPRLRKAQEEYLASSYKKPSAPQKRAREAPGNAPLQKPAADEFWCQACKKIVKKVEGDAHKKSPEHLKNKKQR